MRVSGGRYSGSFSKIIENECKKVKIGNGLDSWASRPLVVYYAEFHLSNRHRSPGSSQLYLVEGSLSEARTVLILERWVHGEKP